MRPIRAVWHDGPMTADKPTTESGEKPATSPSRPGLKLRVRAIGAALVFLMALCRFVQIGGLDRFEHQLYDLALRLRDPLAPSSKIVVVQLDERALNELGRWPWRRSVFADMVGKLAEDRAKVIAFTLAFLEPDSQETLELIDTIGGSLDQDTARDAQLRETLAGLQKASDTDNLFGEAIEAAEAAGTSTVLGYFFHLEQTDLTDEDEKKAIEEQAKRLRKAAYPIVQYPAGALRPDFLRAYAPQASVERLARATPNAGFLQVPTDFDGSVRRALLAAEFGDKVYPSLAVQAAWNYLGRKQLALLGSEAGLEGVAIGPQHYIETDPQGRVLINFPAPPGAFPVYSIADVVKGRFPKGTFRDKVVLIGSNAKGISDVRRTPMAAFHPGVEVHAAILDNLLEHRTMVWSPAFVVLDLIVIFLLGGLGVVVFGRRGFELEFAGMVVVCAAYVAMAMTLLQSEGLYLAIGYPPLTLFLVFGHITVHRYLQEEEERKQIEGTFGRYVAPRVMEQMLENPDMLKLGGEERLITVLFSDLKGFTAASESLTPSEMIELMCEYFEEMTAHIYDHEGLLKEYVGDEIMAIFGAPLVQEDHAVQACHAALGMRSRLRVLSVEWQEKGLPPVGARWGVNSGVMLVGNLGSSYRYSYGALGDNVNLGSRLEGLNNQYGTSILIGENTEELVRDHFHLREVDTVQVKGKSKGVQVYELIASSDTDLKPAQKDLLGEYAAGLAAYRAQQWEDAIARFEAVRKLEPEDGPAKVLLNRSRHYVIDPPGDDWNGVFEAKTK